MQSPCCDGIERIIQRTRTRFKRNNRPGPRIIRVQPAPAPNSSDLPKTNNGGGGGQINRTCPRCYHKIPDGDDVGNTNNPPSPEEDPFDLHLTAYYHVKYCLGMSLNTPYTIRSRERCTKPIFLAIAFLTIVNSLMVVKASILEQSTSLENCINVGTAFSRMLFNMSSVVIAWKYEERIARLIRILKDFGRLFIKSHSRKMVYVALFAIVGLVFMRSLVLAIQSSVRWNRWSVSKAIRFRAYDIAEFVFVWKRSKPNETEAFLDRLTDDINPISVTFAISSFFIEIVGECFEHMNKGYIMAAAVTLMYASKEFEDELIQATTSSTSIPKKVWDMYKSLQLLSDEINTLYGPVISFFHANGFLVGAYFLYFSMHLDVYDGGALYLSTDIIKTAILYSYLAKASNSNESFRKYILGRYMKTGNMVSVEDSDDGFIPIILIEELNTQPIGLKCNTFLINTALGIQFVGMVVQYFLLLVDAGEN